MKKLCKGLTDVQDLPGVYAFTGNGCPSPICRKGKIRTIIIMKKNAFMNHGDLLLSNDIKNIIKQFT